MRSIAAIILLLCSAASASDMVIKAVGRPSPPDPKELVISSPAADARAVAGEDKAAAEKARARLAKLGDKAKDVLPRLCDPKETPDPAARAGAVMAMPSPKTREMVASVAAAAISDPDARPRSEARRAAKADPLVLALVVQRAMAKDPAEAAPAVEALREIKDRRAAEWLFYWHVTMEFRLTITSDASFRQAQIDSYNVIQGANLAVPMRMSFPIQLPSSQVVRVRTTVVGPAMRALVSLTGEDFGDDLGRWRRWLRSQN